MRKIARYGWVKDTPDFRDFRLAVAAPAIATPDTEDLRILMPPVFDQGQVGSCTGNGWAATFEVDLGKQGEHYFRPSRLQIYYDERVEEGTQDYDSGAQIRDGAKVLAKTGCCPEWMWPYDESRVAVKPGPECYAEALKHRAISYWQVPQTQHDFESCLAQKFPIVFGFTVYESFESEAVAHTGIVPMPGRHESQVGGHCVVIVGYDRPRRMFLCRNSWGTAWGVKGYFWMPYDYVLNPSLASDFWTLRRIS
jgi:C1A family cysteine protease